MDAEVRIVTDAVICVLPLSWKCLHWDRGKKWKWKYSGGICLACTVQLFIMQIMSQLKQLSRHDSLTMVVWPLGLWWHQSVSAHGLCPYSINNNLWLWTQLQELLLDCSFFFFSSFVTTAMDRKMGFISLLCFNKWILTSKENFLLDRQGQWETLFCILFSKWMGICHSLL